MKPQSMEEKISYRLFFMGFVGLVCTAVLCLFVFHKAFREQAWTSLEHQADLVSAGYEQLSSPDQLSVFVNGDLRITLIAADGSVVFESATDQQMENHLSRPEIQQAMQSGVGRDCRDSQTTGYETYYYALLLPSGEILRVAQDSETTWSIYDDAIPAIILSCVLMMAAAALMAGLLTKSLVQPVLKMTDDLDRIQDNVPYKEGSLLRNMIINHLGRSQYYRCFRKERPFSPQDQQTIRLLFRQRGISEELSFDYYTNEFNW